MQFFESKSQLSVTGAFRVGDIRHNFADLTKIRRAIGFAPRFGFHEGLKQFLDWAAAQDRLPTAYESSLFELRERGLLHG